MEDEGATKLVRGDYKEAIDFFDKVLKIGEHKLYWIKLKIYSMNLTLGILVGLAIGAGITLLVMDPYHFVNHLLNNIKIQLNSLQWNLK